MDHFWTTVSAVAFVHIVVLIILTGRKMILDWRNERSRRQIEASARKAAQEAYRQPSPDEAIGIGMEGEDVYVEGEMIPPAGVQYVPPHPNVASRPGACPACGQPWPLPGPLPGLMGAPSVIPTASCVLCGREPKRSPTEQAPSQN